MGQGSGRGGEDAGREEGWLDKAYMLSAIRERVLELEDKMRGLKSGRLPDGTPCTYRGACVGRSRVKKDLGTLRLLEALLESCGRFSVDDPELVGAFDRLVEPRRSKVT